MTHREEIWNKAQKALYAEVIDENIWEGGENNG